jgi:hypothetical protein
MGPGRPAGRWWSAALLPCRHGTPSSELAGELAITAGRPARLPGRARIAKRRDLDRAPGQADAEARDAAKVADDGGDHVYPGVGVVDPVHRDLVNAQPGPLGQDQQLGVEKPAGVGRQRQQRPRPIRADGLKTALGIGEASAQRGVQQQVVAP